MSSSDPPPLARGYTVTSTRGQGWTRATQENDDGVPDKGRAPQRLNCPCPGVVGGLEVTDSSDLVLQAASGGPHTGHVPVIAQSPW